MPGAETVLLLASGSSLGLWFGGAAGALIVGALWISRRRQSAHATPPLSSRGTGFPTGPGTAAAATPPARPPNRDRHGADQEKSPPVARRLCAAFHDWLTENQDRPDLWTSFDQFVRERTTEHLGATRVRCYHVRPGSDTLHSLSEPRPAAVDAAVRQGSGSDPSPPQPGPGARAGVLGHVATTGNEFVVGNPAHGPLIDDLAAQTDDPWAWVWPVRGSSGSAVIGVIAVGNLRDPARLTQDTRHTIGEIISLCWRHVACLDRLRLVQCTDPASGGLNRNDFFTLSSQALAESYETNEPVVVAVLALEGLRGLDDGGQWAERDELIERLGQLLAHRIRADDLVGRFTDDRFVILLRRLDSGLGRLIADKLVVAANECLAQLPAVHGQVCVRIGLAGSGFRQPELEELLGSAFDAVERARAMQTAVATDLEPLTGRAACPGAADAPGRAADEG